MISCLVELLHFVYFSLDCNFVATNEEASLRDHLCSVFPKWKDMVTNLDAKNGSPVALVITAAAVRAVDIIR